MSLVAITKVPKNERGRCVAHFCKNVRNLFRVHISFNACCQGASIVLRLCPDHLSELGCATADALDPPRPADKKIMARVPKPVGWQKVMDDNAAKRGNKDEK